jgi:hypothetical protein
VLDHLLAPLMLEIDVDVGRLAALGGDEALEQKVGALGIDLGDAEAEAHRRVRRRAAALAQDAARAGKADDVEDGEEIRRIIERGDQLELVGKRGPHFFRHARRIARGGALPGEMLERVVRRCEPFARLVGILIGELVERERELIRESPRLLDRIGKVPEHPRHLGGRFQVPLGIRREPPARRLERDVLADAGEHVLQAPALRRMIEHVVDRDERHADVVRELRRLREPRPIGAGIEHGCGEPHPLGRDFAQACEDLARITSPLEGEVGAAKLRREGGRFARREFTPLPNPPPQGGRGPALNRGSAENRIIACCDRSLSPRRPLHHDELEAVGVLE